ncbi:MAG: hypothetical protein IJ849_08765 [Selenomonadaceae bacterium]|nr:hypothetical protein [Selenomonadaceae bacterium]
MRRLAVCTLIIFLGCFLVGCKGNVSKLIGAVKREVKQEAAMQVVEGVIDSQVGNKSSTPQPSTRSSVKSNLSKAGALAAVGGAVSQLPTNSDLTLGKVSIGYSRDDVYSLMGRESEIKDPNNSGHLRYQYPEMEVVITAGRVTGFVSNTGDVSTPRGIRQGDSLQKVLSNYGEPYAQSDFDDMTLYEYKMTSLDRRECLMRFAVKNGRVDYISARVLE